MVKTVTTEEWLALVALTGSLAFERFGLTPQPEARVWGWRKLETHLLYFCTHNGFLVTFENETVRVERGTFLWIMPGVRHETSLLAPRRRFRNYYIKFQLTEGDQQSAVRLKEDFVRRENGWELQSLMTDLVHELQSPRDLHDQRARSMLTLLSTMVMGEPVTQRAVLTPQQRLRVHTYLELHAADKVSPRDLAEAVGLSMPYFRRIFQRSFGMSPKHWIVRQRVLVAAMMMLESPLQVKEVAYRLGYCDRYSFSHQFKEIMGVTPRQFRRGPGAEPAIDRILDDVNAAPELRRVDILIE